MTTKTRRSAGITRPHPARAAAEAARTAAEAEAAQPEETQPPAQPEAAAPRELDATATKSADAQPEAGVTRQLRGRADRQRLQSGRVSFAGRAATVYFPSTADRDRAKAAFMARGGLEGYTSETDFWADVILARVEQWENEHNGGEPFVIKRRKR